MSATLEMLEAQVLKLSAADRSRLLERLMDSLDEDNEVEAAWDALADAREALVVGTSADAVPMDQVFARLESRFPG